LSGSAFTVACLVGVPSLHAQRVPAPTQNAVAGAAVFGEKGCVRCHSVGGVGGSIGPDLRKGAGTRPLQDLTAALWNHLPNMSRRMEELGISRPHLTAREAGDLFAYLYTLGYFGTPGDAERGSLVFEEAGCILCHQFEGKGGVVGPMLDGVGARGVPIEIAAAMWNHGPAMTREAKARGIRRPDLSGRDLTDLLAFLSRDSGVALDDNLYVLPGNPDAGREILSARRCVQCHGEPGSGGISAPDLAYVARGTSLTDFVALMWDKAPRMMDALQRREIEFPTLDAADFADIVAYLYARNYFSDSGRAARGPALLEAKGCTECHEVDRLAAEPGLNHQASITAALWNHLAVPDLMDRSELEWPFFTGREMGDLMAYFQASSP